MATYHLPAGVTCGKGVVNLVNCKFRNYGSQAYPDHAYFISVQGCAEDDSEDLDSPIHLVCRYINTPRASTDPALYSAWTLSYTPRGPVFGGYCTDSPTIVTADSWYYTSSRFLYASLVGDLTYPVDIKGSNPLLYGTSQYQSGYAPVPTTNRLEVGTGKAFSSIDDAYAAAGHGDNIVIYPGSYTMTARQGLSVSKCVRFYGATENPDDVIIYPVTSTTGYPNYDNIIFSPYLMTNVPEEYRGPGLFHLTLWGNDEYLVWTTLVRIYRGSYLTPDPTPWPYSPPSSLSSIMFSCNT